MCIDLNCLHPHEMYIEPIRIESEFSQSTVGGGLNVNSKWIG